MKNNNVSKIYHDAKKEIEDFTDKLGETFYDRFEEPSNSTAEMGGGIRAAFDMCSTEKEYKIADAMLTGICGYNLSSIVEEIKEKDGAGYTWESL